MGKVRKLRCVSCGREYGPGELDYTCPQCGIRRGTLEVIYDLKAVKDEFSTDNIVSLPFDIRRYLALLPVDSKDDLPSLKIGGTPLYRLGEFIDQVGEVWLKDDSINPTASYKDRASALALAKAKERNVSVLTCASTGNAASSLAGLAAPTEMETFIFVPASAPQAKIAQLLIYGAHVFAVEGNYDQAYDLCMEAADEFGWYNRSAAINPYLVEGKKTGAFEMAEQLDWRPPDKIFVSTGDGSIISGVCKGFTELYKIGVTDKIPEVIGVQAKGASPIALAFKRFDGDHVTIEDQEVNTIADSIAVGKPRDIIKAVKYVHRVGGFFVSVADEEIKQAIVDLARCSGVFAEPAGATSFAGFRKVLKEGRIKKSDRVGIFITGSGLKDIKTAKEAVPVAKRIKPKMADLRYELRKSGLAKC